MSWRWTLAASLLITLLGQSLSASSQNLSDSTEIIHLNRVIIIGNKKTKDWIILRELTLKPGDSLPRYTLSQTLQRDKNKIYNLRIFHTVQVRSLEMPDKSFDILIEVEERWFSFPVPIFELSDRNFNEWWENYDHKLNRVNYGLRLFLYNFRGRNETIRLTAQFGFTPKFDLVYRIPYIDKRQKQGLIFEANYSEPKNLAYQTTDHKLVFLSGRERLRKRYGFGVTYTYRKSFYQTHAITLDYDNSTIADTIQTLILQNPDPDRSPSYYQDGLKKQWYTSLAYLFISEHRDVIVYPLNGYQIIAGIRKIGLGLGENVNQTLLNASFAWHKDIGKKFYFSNFTSGYYSTPVDQPYYLYYGQGYRKQFVRGYEIYVIEGPWFGLNKTTLKRKIFQHTYRLSVLPWEKFQHLPVALYLKAYADVGYTRNYAYYEARNQNSTLSNRLIGGLGLGFDLVTAYDGVLRVEYTFNREGANGFFLHLKKEF